MNDKMNELQAYALRDMVQGLLQMKTVTTVEIFGKAAEPAVQAIQESLDASVPALVDTLGWALHELSLLKRRVEAAESARAQAIINDLELKAMSSNQRLAELEGVLEAVPVAALQTIEEIAPLIARDKLSSPEAWMKAWEEVSPWLASLRALRVSPETPWHLGEIG